MTEHRKAPWFAGVAILLAVFLAACAPPGQYPVSGQQCGPNDPVKDLDKAHCDPF